MANAEFSDALGRAPAGKRPRTGATAAIRLWLSEIEEARARNCSWAQIGWAIAHLEGFDTPITASRMTALYRQARSRSSPSLPTKISAPRPFVAPGLQSLHEPAADEWSEASIRRRYFAEVMAMRE